jgi:hypothetical protein
MVLALLSTLLPLYLLFVKYGTTGKIVIGVYLLCLLVPFFLLPKYLAKSEITIQVDGRTFEISWIMPYFLSRVSRSIKFNASEIKAYRYEESYNFSTLRIEFHSGNQIKFHRWFFDLDDDFNKFMTYFKQSIKTYNNLQSTISPVVEEKSLMENRVFLIAIGLVVTLVILGGIVLMLKYGINNSKGWITLFIVLGPFIWVINQIISGLRK